MPTAPTYALLIPSALDELRERADELVTRQEVEALLGVKKRTANDVISAAGPVKVGNANAVMREDLILYLEHFGIDGSVEAERRRKFAQNLSRMREEFISTPRLVMDLEKVDPELIARANRRRLGGLPDGVVLEPGRITIQQFSTGQQAIEKLMLLAMAIGVDLEEFEEKVKVDPPSEKTA